MKPLRIYADTSVLGGCFDEEFSVESNQLLDGVKAGKYLLVISDTVLEELDQAPPRVWDLIKKLPQEFVETVNVNEEVKKLRDAYLRMGVVGPASEVDAEHIALASVVGVDLIVSWNFKHIVHFDKIRGYHGVNLLNGYKPIPIHSPREVV